MSAPPAPKPAKIYRVWLAEVGGSDSAEAEWERLLSVYPDLLGQRVPLLRRVDLGEAGVKYRVLAGPFDGRPEASSLCAAIHERDAAARCMVVLN
jgi:hypothetical protein